MKRAIFFPILFAWCVNVSADGIRTGNDLKNACTQNPGFSEGFCFGYIAGVVDTLYQAFGDKVICIENGVSAEQMVGIFKLYADRKPEVLHNNASDLVYLSLAEKFPCGNRKTD